jgi:hypothetical protein
MSCTPEQLPRSVPWQLYRNVATRVALCQPLAHLLLVPMCIAKPALNEHPCAPVGDARQQCDGSDGCMRLSRDLQIHGPLDGKYFVMPMKDWQHGMSGCILATQHGRCCCRAQAQHLCISCCVRLISTMAWRTVVLQVDKHILDRISQSHIM